jgi:hypothetical protein
MVGFFIGHLLPNQIEGVTEIVPMGGLRFSTPLGVSSSIEGTAAFGKGNGASYNTADLDYRYDSSLDEFLAMLYGGVTLHYYKPGDLAYKLGYGVNLGMGLMIPISEVLNFRLDMKFNMNPGTALFIGFGFSFDLGASSGGGS